jgi:hypothetical protein
MSDTPASASVLRVLGPGAGRRIPARRGPTEKQGNGATEGCHNLCVDRGPGIARSDGNHDPASCGCLLSKSTDAP